VSATNLADQEIERLRAGVERLTKERDELKLAAKYPVCRVLSLGAACPCTFARKLKEARALLGSALRELERINNVKDGMPLVGHNLRCAIRAALGEGEGKGG